MYDSPYASTNYFQNPKRTVLNGRNYVVFWGENLAEENHRPRPCTQNSQRDFISYEERQVFYLKH